MMPFQLSVTSFSVFGGLGSPGYTVERNRARNFRSFFDTIYSELDGPYTYGCLSGVNIILMY